MVEMIEKFKEEEPDNDFAELDVTERIETKFIVRKTKSETFLILKMQYFRLQMYDSDFKTLSAL